MAKLSDPEHPGADSPDLDPASRNPRDEEDDGLGGVPPRGCYTRPLFLLGVPEEPAANRTNRMTENPWSDGGPSLA